MQEQEIERVAGEMSPEQQVDEWVKGNSIHNNNRYYRVVDKDNKIVAVKRMEGGECCPDFSCCEPSLKWPEATRISFKNADEKIRSQMLSMALSELLSKQASEIDVHIAGDAESKNSFQ